MLYILNFLFLNKKCHKLLSVLVGDLAQTCNYSIRSNCVAMVHSSVCLTK